MKAKLLAALAILACAPALVEATPGPLVIKEDHGGRIHDYLEGFETLAATHRRVVIDGPCISACTLIFGRVPYDQICVTPRATFGFHSAAYGEFNKKTHERVGKQHFALLGTLVLTWRYPPAVRAAIRRRGWDLASPHPAVIMIPAAELDVYRECQ